jgi:hypothetical protein
MARSVSNINDYIVQTLVTNFAAIGITINPTLWSKRNLLRAICYTVAIAQALMEQLQDLYKQQVEDIVSKAAAASSKWVQDKMFKFQYSATNPQVIALIDTIPTYPVIDETLRIIKACSVTSDISNTVSIKVAKGDTLTALSSPELSSAQGYIDIIGIEGIDYVVLSLNPDKIYIDAEVFYQGQYAAVIQDSVINTLNDYLKKLSITNFDGGIKMADVEAVIRNVVGVNDVVLKNVRARPDTDVFSAGIDLILNTAIIQRQFITIAGYIVQETTSGKTFADSLVFTAQ